MMAGVFNTHIEQVSRSDATRNGVRFDHPDMRSISVAFSYGAAEAIANLKTK
jgi:hypothetical protein